MTSRHARPTPLVAAGAFGALLIAIPVAASIRDVHEDRERILVFAALTIAIALGGLVALAKARLVHTTPASAFHALPLVYVVAMSVPWAMVIVDTPHATYFLLALIAVSLWLLPEVVGSIVALALTVFTILGQVVHHGWSTGSVMGPLLIALVMLGFMHMYRAMLTRARETAQLYAELKTAHAQLVDTEREAGKLAERTRLGRDLHDTVAQSLSSIQVLLHLAESDPERRSEHIATAREAAASSLAETRAFISALTPPDLAGRNVTAALSRIVARYRERTAGVPDLRFTVEGEPRRLPMPVETSLVRCAQASIENVLAHAHATHCHITLTFEDTSVRLDIDDDGIGFDPELALATGPLDGHGYGLPMLQDRARELGGYAAVVSPTDDDDRGTLVSVTLPAPAPKGEKR